MKPVVGHAVAACMIAVFFASPIFGRPAPKGYANVAQVRVEIQGAALPGDVRVAEPLVRGIHVVAMGGAGEPGQNAQKGPGQPHVGDLILTGHLPLPPALNQWFNAIANGSSERKDIAVASLDLNGAELARWNLAEAFPCESSFDPAEGTWTMRIAVERIDYQAGSVAQSSNSSGGSSATSGNSAGSGDDSAHASGGETPPPPAPAAEPVVASNDSQSGTGSTARGKAGAADSIRVRAPADPAAGYRVTLRNGTVVQAQSVVPARDRSQMLITTAEGKKLTVNRADIAKMEPVSDRSRQR